MNGISMVFQNLSLMPDLTVWQNIVLGIEKKKVCFWMINRPLNWRRASSTI